MTTIDRRARRARRVTGLRRTAFATIVALLIEYGFGLFLFGTTPKSANGAGLFVAFDAVISSGPAILVIHALLGTLILLGGLMSLIRSIQTRFAWLIGANVFAFVAILFAWLAGDATASDPMGPAGRVMGIATGIAILAYVIVLLLAPKSVQGGGAS
jgi:hypothetical protein